jgi:DNA-directed RNA polymerase specialized sigma24 family protein
MRSDALLVTAVIRRDHEGLADLYDRYSAVTYSILLKIARDQYLAADLLQEFFHRIPTVIGQYDVTYDCLDSWMVLNARRYGIDHIRSSRRKPACISDKAASNQQLLEWVLLEGCSLRHVAERLNEEPRSVKSRVRSAIQSTQAISKLRV